MRGRSLIVVQVIIAFMVHLSITMEERHFGIDPLLVPMGSRMGSDCECGRITRKIDDERLAKVKIAGGRLPWLAELISSDGSHFDDTGEFLLCFGTVVSLQTVLFPASCIQRNFYSNTGRSKPRVKLHGTDNWKESIQDISNIRVHPGYRKKLDHDLALIKLRQKIDFNQTGVVPVCLPLETRRYAGFGFYPNTKLIEAQVTSTSPSHDGNQTEFQETDLESRAKPTSKPNYVLDYSVIRSWLYRRAVGYDYSSHYGRFPVEKMNDSNCQALFPEMLRSKVNCIQQKEIRNIAKQNEYFFKKLELGMPVMLSNTTLAKGKPQPSTAKFILEGIRSPGRHGIPMLEMRENTMALLKIEDYVRWIGKTSGSANFCRA